MEDKHIVDMFWARNEDALVETQKKYEKYGMYIAGHLLGNREDAAECFNDALLRLWKAIPPHRPEKLSAFLGKIVRGLAVDRIRERNAMKRGGEIRGISDELAECFAGAEPFEDTQESVLIGQALNCFLATLSERVRVMFVKRYWYMCSVKEIAGEMSLGESYVKVTLMRTRQNLRAYLEGEGISV